MFLYPHESANCPRCGGRILYGLKEEATGWKVVLECNPDTGCGRQFSSRWIPLSNVDHFDDAYERAASAAEEVSNRGY
jgi:hypothetical protein